MKQKISTLLISLAFASVALAEYYTEGGTFVSVAKPTNTQPFQSIVDNYQGVDGESVVFSVVQQDGSYWADYKNDFEFKNDLIVENNNKNTWFPTANIVYSTTGATITLNNINSTIVSTQTGNALKTRYSFKGVGKAVNIIFNKTPVYASGGSLWLNNANATFKESGTHGSVLTYAGSLIKADNVNLTLSSLELRGGDSDGSVKLYDGNTQFDLGSKKGIRVDGSFAVNGGTIYAKASSGQLGYYEVNNGTYDRADYLHVITVAYENKSVAESVKLEKLNLWFTGSPVQSGTGRSGYVDFLDITTMDKGDIFYSELDLTSNEYASKIFINNKNILEYAADELSIEKSGNFYAYTMTIPEPSTYAMIFGALALGFVAYRRRK